MVIGILTVHKQINYGAILQTYALQSTLERLGHKVVILDRNIDSTTGPILGAISNGSLRCWLQILLRECLGLWDIQDIIRRIRSLMFIKKHLHLTKYKFNDWTDAPEKLGVDLIVVGSDQIWNTKHHDPRVFLLEGAPNIPAITYAASFGTDGIDEKWISLFQKQLPKFKKLSVREEQGQNILKPIGFDAEHVLDPTIIATDEIWKPFIKSKKNNKKLLVLYLITKPSYDEIMLLDNFAKKNDCIVKIYLGTTPQVKPSSYLQWKTHFTGLSKSIFGRIKWALTDTPKEYLNSLANADWVITCTFHGFMFSCIFKKQVRILKNPHRDNLSSFNRLVNFADNFVKGDIIKGDISDAIDSISTGATVSYDNELLDKKKVASVTWLEHTVNDALNITE